jgi:hypothetical protein
VRIFDPRIFDSRIFDTQLRPPISVVYLTANEDHEIDMAIGAFFDQIDVQGVSETEELPG